MAQVPFPITSFQYPDTSAVAEGYLLIRLNKDCQISDLMAQIGAKVKIKVPLDNGGSPTDVATFYPNSELNPTDSVYIYEVYNAQGQIVLGPISIVIGSTTGSGGFGSAFGGSFGS